MVVVDSAAVVDALTVVEGTDELRARLDGEDLHAPALLDYEVLSTLRGLCLGGKLSAARATDALSDFNDLPVRRWPSNDAFLRRAFQLRDNLSSYDAAYVVLAEAIGCPLLTRDTRIARASRHTADVEVL